MKTISKTLGGCNRKTVMGKSKLCNDKFPKSLDIDKEEITDKKIIAELYNKFFINVGSNLADKMPPSKTNFESYLPNITPALSDKPLSEKEFRDAFLHFALHVNVIRTMYHELKIPLMNIFSQSLLTGIFPDKMKIFKNVKKSIASNYRPTSVLPCFSKFLECIMYNRLYSYLTENNILFNN